MFRLSLITIIKWLEGVYKFSGDSGHELPISISWFFKNSHHQLLVETELISEEDADKDMLIDYLEFLKELKKIERKSFSICVRCGSHVKLVPATELMFNGGLCKLCREKKQKEEKEEQNKMTKTGTWLDNY